MQVYLTAAPRDGAGHVISDPPVIIVILLLNISDPPTYPTCISQGSDTKLLQARGATAVTAVLTTSEACWDIFPRDLTAVSVLG
jgi:hypothetical protein